MSSAEPPVGRFATRRKSVFAETYNPEEDDEEEGVRVGFKSDFLFSNLIRALIAGCLPQIRRAEAASCR